MPVNFKVIDTELQFHDDLKKYYDLSCEFQAAHNKLYKSVKYELDIKREPSDVFKTIENAVKQFIAELINRLSNYGVFDKTESDYLNTNNGYLQLLNATNYYYDYSQSTTKHHTAIAEANKESASIRINSSITGLDFGIISSSIIDHAVYAAMNKSEIQKQSLAAFERLCTVCDNINATRDKNISAELNEYYTVHFAPAVTVALSAIYGHLLSTFSNDLNACSQLDLSCLDKIDVKRSNEIIANIRNVDNKKGVFLKALELCPYNVEVYRKAYINYLQLANLTLQTVCGELIDFFNLRDLLQNYLVSKEELCQKAACALEKYDYTVATELYSEIAQTYSQSYEGWLGLLLCETRKFSMVKPDIAKVEKLYSSLKKVLDTTDQKSDINDVYYEYRNKLHKLARLNKDKDEFEQKFLSEHKDVLCRNMNTRLVIALFSSFISFIGFIGSFTDPSLFIPLFIVAICIAGGVWFSLISQDKEIKRLNKEKVEKKQQIDNDIKSLTNSIGKGCCIAGLL